MRHLILSDMHGNWDAMAAVLRHVRRKQFDSAVVLGDLVGYGAAPESVIERVQRFGRRLTVIRGNHDKVVAGIDEGIGFNPMALASVFWTRDRLRDAHRRYLESLPQGPLELDGFLICHGSPIDEDQYIVNEATASESFEEIDFSLCFFGHTHVPCLFLADGNRVERQPLVGDRFSIELQPGVRYLVNPGSVGQPRDRDPRAAYMIYDSDTSTLSWYRQEYPIGKAQSRILKAGLPEMLAERLAHGL